jgi:Alr-MurF fusion protein
MNHMEYSMRHIGQITGGKWLQLASDDSIGQLLLDSRRLIFPATTLFFALKGPRRDGVRFVGEMYKRGVRNFVVGPDAGTDALAGLADANILVVPDTLAALQQLVAAHRQAFSLPVIGITGSNGKTIVKEWLNQLLADSYHIVRSPKSYNSQTGVPLSVWQIEPGHELAIFEAGISKRGEMARLEPIIRPTIGVFTNIGEAHSEGFVSLAEKAAQKLDLFEHAGSLIYCGDQPETEKTIKAWADRLARRGSGIPVLTSWGRSIEDTVRVDSMQKCDGWTTVAISYPNLDLTFSVPFTDDASVENAMHCLCVLLLLKVPGEKIVTGMAELSSIAMRLELKKGINHCSIINDSYSADLNSLTIALDFLVAQQQHTRRTVILSDFLESGREEDELYATIAEALALTKIDRLIGIGARIGAHAAAIAEKFSGETVFYLTVDAFRRDLAALHFRDETILIKGARVFEFEEIDRLLTEQIHQTVMEVNLNAMAANLRAYRQMLQPGTLLMAMVKAYGYGSGSFEIANLLQFHGVDYLGVAYADEGVVLRKAGIRVPIMIMNTENSSFDSLVEYNLQPVIYSSSLLHSFDRWLKREGIPAFPVHIELETGMNRLGFPAAEWDELLRALPLSAFKVQSVFSHFAASEEAQQDAFSLRQAAAYLEMAARLEGVLGYPFIRHLANSAAIVRHPELQLDMVRLGIGLYGIDSANSHRLDLQEVSTLKTTIAQIKHLHEGDTIGYNRKGIAVNGTVIATVRIGYADGYARVLGNGVGKMWINGRLAPTIGIISMDMTMIDITGIPDVKEGDEVVVFGKELSVSQLAAWAQTIPYEILTGVSARVRRIYFED